MSKKISNLKTHVFLIVICSMLIASPAYAGSQNRQYLVDRETRISSGYISETIKSQGEIIGSSTERSVFGKDDYIYIRMMNPVKSGDKFYIIRSLGEVNHPQTEIMAGYLIDVLGILEVEGIESGQIKARIIASYSEIMPGDLLDDFYEIEPLFPVENPRKPDINGFVLASKQKHIANAPMDIVYIDKGKRDGLEVGDMLGTLSSNIYTVPNGNILVIGVRESTSTAIIVRSRKEIEEGDIIGLGGAEKITVSKPVVIKLPEENLENEIDLFIHQYTGAYESGDIDRFMSFYSTSAIENDNLRYDDIKYAYRRNFQKGAYTYALTDIRMQKKDDIVIVAGIYLIKQIQGNDTGAVTQGNIKWTLSREDGVLKIIKVDYNRI